jgi:hypothetical protein
MTKNLLESQRKERNRGTNKMREKTNKEEEKGKGNKV